ncbi:MAG TPA: hypothetical protein VL551_35505 [Actinospica sp.]|jgi:hypothetical protein|nr:hypothetical protein [Actinospica sp.]
MPERDELQRLAGLVEQAAVFTEPERIRVIGAQRNRRRRAGRAVAGTTGALAVVAFLGTGLATGALGNGHGTVSAGSAVAANATASGPATAKASATVSSTGSGSTGVAYVLPTSVTASRGSAVVTVLQQRGFVEVTTKSVGSNTVPAGNAVDITDANGHSVLGHQVSIATALTVVVSAGPAH